ncbi:MAG: UDP-2,3-diacylglucosamine diphosphatase, partial [Wenzhouxiangellaceae bacterium]
HRATISTIDNKLYLNCGDWVESCTALLEHHDGSIELVHFSDRAESLDVLAPVVAERAA